ncbi:DciA family protein [uncultured Veillonella sp.]|uniref:DciA family protein n=1 Tax=uncultured Veillonella sp. TaxID=159268 RepID=UPI0026394630|nr:DciA family protein [uncultured Veillonella sp.]
MRNNKLESFEACMDFIQDTRSYEGFDFFALVPIMKLYYYWPQVVSKRVSRFCQIISIKPPTITLGANTSASLQEIKMATPQLLKAINTFYSNYYNRPIITEIKAVMNKKSSIREIKVQPLGVWEDFRQRERIDFTKINLSDEELATIDATCAQITNEKLRQVFREAQIKQYKNRHVMEAKGYHPCPSCGLWISPEETICKSCINKAQRVRISDIQEVLFQYPYWKYDNILTMFPHCSMEEFNEAKRNMIYHFLNQIRAGSKDNYDLYMAAMLITAKPADQLEPKFVVNLTNKYRKPEFKTNSGSNFSNKK